MKSHETDFAREKLEDSSTSIDTSLNQVDPVLSDSQNSVNYSVALRVYVLSSTSQSQLMRHLASPTHVRLLRTCSFLFASVVCVAEVECLLSTSDIASTYAVPQLITSFLRPVHSASYVYVALGALAAVTATISAGRDRLRKCDAVHVFVWCVAVFAHARSLDHVINEQDLLLMRCFVTSFNLFTASYALLCSRVNHQQAKVFVKRR